MRNENMKELFEIENFTIQTFDDLKKRDDKRLAQIFRYDPVKIDRLINKGAGIFFTPNPQENPNERAIKNTTALAALSFDLDVAKEEHKISREKIKARKTKLLQKIKTLEIKPNVIIESKNGYQIVYVLADPQPLASVADRKQASEYYKTVIAGFAEKTDLRSEGDNLCRVLRLPNTLHQKNPSDKFLIKLLEVNSKKVTLDEFAKIYPPIIHKSPPDQAKPTTTRKSDDPVVNEILIYPVQQALEKLSGTAHVDYEQFTFSPNGSGSIQIIINGERKGQWIDPIQNTIGGSGKGRGNPTIIQFVAWYQENRYGEARKAARAKSIQILKEVLGIRNQEEQQELALQAQTERIDVSKFRPMGITELADTLSLTIKMDTPNKIITFLCYLAAYTDDSQMNTYNNAPSTTGKSYIPIEITSLFPEKDVLMLSSSSPTAFYHEQGEYDKERNVIKVDLARKIIIFLDQPNTALLERIRALLSHDRKEIVAKITDKDQRGGNATKTVVLIGYPSVTFCTANFALNEQESTRFFLLSPEITEEKIKAGIDAAIEKISNLSEHSARTNANPQRNLLKERILAIRQQHITEINIDSPQRVSEMAYDRFKQLKPRHMRDIARIMNLAKACALFNLWFRKRAGTTITANDEDIQEAFNLWDMISEAQELNLPPYIHDFFKEIIVPAFDEKNNSVEGSRVKIGISRKDILRYHQQKRHTHLSDWTLRVQIISMLETSGLISQEDDPNDHRIKLIHPTPPLTVSPQEATKQQDENNSETPTGVNNQLAQAQSLISDDTDKEKLLEEDKIISDLAKKREISPIAVRQAANRIRLNPLLHKGFSLSERLVKEIDRSIMKGWIK